MTHTGNQDGTSVGKHWGWRPDDMVDDETVLTVMAIKTSYNWLFLWDKKTFYKWGDDC